MRILLFSLGLLGLVSGGLKFRDRIMNKIGTSPFALGEVGAGVLACAVAALVPDAVVLQSVVGVLTFGAIAAGSYHQSRLTAAFRRRRELSESHRLRHFLESQPMTPEPEEGPHGA